MYVVRPESLRSNAQRSNANTAHVANASTDLRSFNLVCVYVRLRTFAIVCLCELVRDRIDTRATSLILPCGARVAQIVCMQAPISEKISYLALILCMCLRSFLHMLDANALCTIALNRFACDRDTKHI